MAVGGVVYLFKIIEDCGTADKWTRGGARGRGMRPRLGSSGAGSVMELCRCVM